MPGDRPVKGDMLSGVRQDPRYGAGYEALQAAQYQVAQEYFSNATAEERNASALEGLAMALSQGSQDDAAIEAREAAYDLYRQIDDQVGAGRIAVILTVDYSAVRGEFALANGWLQRA